MNSNRKFDEIMETLRRIESLLMGGNTPKSIEEDKPKKKITRRKKKSEVEIKVG